MAGMTVGPTTARSAFLLALATVLLAGCNDGCGGSCGCEAGAVCTIQARCCVPDCSDRACGDDGCGGSCGWCDGGACDEGACKAPVLSPAAVVQTLTLPDAEAVGCLDQTGDERPDNGAAALVGVLAGFGVDANLELAHEVETGVLRLGLVAAGLTDGETSPDVALYLGEPGLDDVMTVMTDRYGEPLYRTRQATWEADGSLTTGDALLTLPYRTAQVELPLLVEHTRLRLAGLDRSAEGWTVASGALGGAVFKADVDLWLYRVRLWCATDPEAPADVCGYAQMVDMSLVEIFLTWDLEFPECGKRLQVYDPNDPMIVRATEDNCQAVSLCFLFSGVPGTLNAPRGGPGSLAFAEISGPDLGGNAPVISCGCRFDATGPSSTRSWGGAAVLLSAAAIAIAFSRRRTPKRG